MSEYGAVIYTDGGCRPNPGAGGWGVHGYIFKKQDITLKPTKVKTSYVTAEGYHPQTEINEAGKVSVVDITKIEPVEVVEYIDGYGGFPINVTNNYAELSAVNNAINLIYNKIKYEDGNLKSINIISDSEYALKSIKVDLNKAEANGWKDNNGALIKNSDLWSKIHIGKVKLQEEGCSIKPIWIKGHDGHLGNTQADMMATLGVHSSRRNLKGNEVWFSSTKKYWTPDYERHPLLGHRRLYFNNNTDTSSGIYYTGSHGKHLEDLFKRQSDSSLAIIKLNEPIKEIKELIEHQLSFMGGSEYPEQKNVFIPDMLFSVDLNKFYSNEVQRNINKFGLDSLYIKNAKKIGLRALDDEPVIEDLNPPLMSYLADTRISEIEILFNEYLENRNESKNILVYDITSYFYDVKEKISKKKKKDESENVVIEYTLSKNIKMGDSSVKVEVNVNYKETILPITLTLTPNIDIPSRSAFKHLEDQMPKVKLIYWFLKDTNIIKYATIIECRNGDIGIWTGLFCNQHFILSKKEEIK